MNLSKSLHKLTYNPKLTGERMNEVNEASPANKVSDVERVVMCELEFLENWLQYAGTPIGQECCGRAGSECCGCPEPVYLSAEQVLEQMANRHREIQAMLRGNSDA